MMRATLAGGARDGVTCRDDGRDHVTLCYQVTLCYRVTHTRYDVKAHRVSLVRALAGSRMRVPAVASGALLHGSCAPRACFLGRPLPAGAGYRVRGPPRKGC